RRVRRVRRGGGAVEDVVGGDLEQPRAGRLGEHRDPVPVDRRRRLLRRLGTVDVGPPGRVDDDIAAGDRGAYRGRVGDVEDVVGGRDDVGLARLGQHRAQVAADHPARAGDQPAHQPASRALTGSHQSRFWRYHATVPARPASMPIRGTYPSSSRIFMMSREYRRSWPLRSGTGCTMSQPAPQAASSRSVSSRLVSSVPPPMWYTSPRRPFSRTSSMPRQWSSTCNQSRMLPPSPYSGTLLPSSRLVTNSGITFSGNWCGP